MSIEYRSIDLCPQLVLGKAKVDIPWSGKDSTKPACGAAKLRWARRGVLQIVHHHCCQVTASVSSQSPQKVLPIFK
jgi:hypothetical protein